MRGQLPILRTLHFSLDISPGLKWPTDLEGGTAEWRGKACLNE